ncbi:DNA glycosylase [Roridomyces roridus]|uniref:DNA-(apurinic or apyrimidinic site) lyase n=1 Tax=Roridomyces roridus TaxID=1738132 RepID=A0AAD7FQ09_9AGAR|nr:DNA glycosylase [Roridomyces roridus]
MSLWHSLQLPQSQLSLAAIEWYASNKTRPLCFIALSFRTLSHLPTLHLSLRNAETLVWLNDYFQLEVDLEKLYLDWAARDKVFSSIETRFAGIRMLRQDPWENLISFICSSNNNIGRITKMVQNLCTHYSPPLLSLADPSDPTTEVQYHPFPSPSVLAASNVGSTLRGLGFGYRADFIQRTAKMLVDTHGEGAEKFLASLRDADTATAREELLKFVGVGRKVADCVLLMSLDKKEVIPVDTHVHQIAIKHYGLKGSLTSKTTMNPKLYEEINSKLVTVWGDYAGWAHSVLFTSDLKAFASYGLEAPTTTGLPTPPSTTITKQTEERGHR